MDAGVSPYEFFSQQFSSGLVQANEPCAKIQKEYRILQIFLINKQCVLYYHRYRWGAVSGDKTPSVQNGCRCLCVIFFLVIFKLHCLPQQMRLKIMVRATQLVRQYQIICTAFQGDFLVFAFIK
eukprot:TRINITY_DN20488_c0_g2_i1.p4 TRINITY_DN20488_c0_g2~~TRINITY_DN20488_c0_g2_i1.p4  ORF type:complete len:124 (-),score=6.70 TRINITY_DN20488_c0_g2_i1:254-625(-)